MKYFFLAEKVVKGSAFAYTENEDVPANELVLSLRGRRQVPFELALKRIKHTPKETKVDDKIADLKNKWVDYPSNSLAWPLMSLKMKTVVERNLSGLEGINWLEVIIRGDNEKRIHYLPQFTKELDVLDLEKTIFVDGTNHVVIPCFSLQKISRFNLFHRPGDFWEIPSGLYISEKIKNELIKEKVTGIEFENIKVSV